MYLVISTILVVLYCIPYYIYIIESVDSISRDGPDMPMYVIHYKM